MKRLIRRFNSNESGAVLTEFVITLPIFVMIFVGIVNLHKLEWNNNRVKYLAATEMWDEAMAIHDTYSMWGAGPLAHALPVLAASNAMGEISAHPSPQGDMPAQMKNLGLMTGSRLEARGAGTWAGGSGAPYEYGSDFAEDMTKDQFINPLPMPMKTSMMPFLVAVPSSLFGTRHASAIGTRYGIVAGESSRTVSIPGHTGNFNYGYDVLISPVSVPGGFLNELIVVGHSRLAAEDSPCLSSVLKISNDGDYDC